MEVILYTKDTCKACYDSRKAFNRLKLEYPQIKFYKVNIKDSMAKDFISFLSGYPTFVIKKDNQIREKSVGGGSAVYSTYKILIEKYL